MKFVMMRTASNGRRLRTSVILLSLVALLLFSSNVTQAAGPSVFINELHYDNSGTDVGEAIEVAGPAGTNLAGWSVVLYNGAGGAPYDTIDLSGTIPNQQAGFGALDFARAPIQNGSPDGLALVDPGGTAVQFLSYEGSFVAVGGPANGLTSTDIGVSESTLTPVGDSLQVIGTGNRAGDFTWAAAQPSTFGGVNTGQTFTLSVLVLDGLGGVHSGGSAPPMLPPTPYFGFDAAEDLELAAVGYYVLDAFGGAHAGGGAAALNPLTPYFGFDIARDLELTAAGFFVLDGFGGLHAGGGATLPNPATPYFGFDAAVDLEVIAGGYYVLDAFGGFHVGGGAAVLNPLTPYFGFDIARDLELTAAGFFVLDGFGGLHAGGGANLPNPATPYFGFDAAVDLEVIGGGYFVLDAFGAMYAGGAAMSLSPATPYFGFNIARDFEIF